MLVKICGLRSSADVEVALACKADFYGIIFHEKSPRYVSPNEARNFPAGSPLRVGVFTSTDAKAISDIVKVAGLDLIQLHGEQDASLAQKLGGERVIRVLWPMRYSTLAELEQEAEKWAPHCSMYLLDAGKSGGGSGKSLAWKQLAGLCLPHPWLLAGGLGPDNVGEAIKLCKPHGVDLNSGVEDERGQKSPEKIRAALLGLVAGD